MAVENNCSFIGRLGADPIVRSTQAGDQVANFRIAVNERFGVDASGNPKEVTTWINGVAWKKLAEVMGQYCRKGDMLSIQGRMRNRTWKDQEGNDRYTTEIVSDSVKFLTPKNSNGTTNKPVAENAPPPDDSQIPGVTPNDLPF